MIRRFFVFMHRWVGLLMAGFLIIVGLTGSILAFYPELDRLVTPQLHAAPQERPRLDLATLAERAEALVPPEAIVASVRYELSDQAIATVKPRGAVDSHAQDPRIGFDQLFLDPWTGAELGRRMRGDLSQGVVNLMPFIYILHDALAVHGIGTFALGIVATLWTVDCFVGFYLTLPVSLAGFFRHWKTAWKVKWRGGAYRVNFDLHRAGGLWLWPILFIFAWSSVMFNLRPVYDVVMHALLRTDSFLDAVMAMPKHERPVPKLDWRAASATGERLLAEEARREGFEVRGARGISYAAKVGAYVYLASTDRDLSDQGGATMLMFDGDTGEKRLRVGPNGSSLGATIGEWLRVLHMGRVFGLPYRIFVLVVGLAIAMLSGTGIYIWWKKRRARKLSSARSRGRASASGVGTRSAGRRGDAVIAKSGPALP